MFRSLLVTKQVSITSIDDTFRDCGESLSIALEGVNKEYNHHIKAFLKGSLIRQESGEMCLGNIFKFLDNKSRKISNVNKVALADGINLLFDTVRVHNIQDKCGVYNRVMAHLSYAKYEKKFEKSTVKDVMYNEHFQRLQNGINKSV